VSGKKSDALYIRAYTKKKNGKLKKKLKINFVEVWYRNIFN